MFGDIWAFDVDGCLVDSLTGTSLRPGAVELLTDLRAARCRTVLWSAGGSSYAQEKARALDVHHLFDGFHGKERRGDDGRYLADHLGSPVIFVDDRPEDVPAEAPVLAVSPYLAPNPHDRGLVRAAEAWR